MNSARSLLGWPLLLATVLPSVFAQDAPEANPDLAAAPLPVPAIAVDQPQPDGPWLLRGASYKARVDAAGFTFVPRPPAMERLRPIGFRLAAFRVGGEAQPLTATAPQRSGNFVRTERGALAESVEARADGVEQTFVVARLPHRGALQLAIEVDTQLGVADVGDGVRFRDADHDVHYGEAIAIDADGQRCAAPTHYAAGSIVIDVPAAFVASARLPLTIDPLVASQLVGFPAVANASPTERDVVWDEVFQRYVVVFEAEWAPGDSDVFAYYLTTQLQHLEGVIVDVGMQAWKRPRMAYLRSGGQCLVVCQARNAADTAWTIRGRAFNPGAVSGEVVVEDAALPGHLPGDKWTPDVCGDSDPNPSAFYTVVWESRDASGGDVHMKQLQSTMNLVTTSPLILANGNPDQRLPSISKSYGGATLAQRHAVVVFESRQPAATETDIHAAVVGRDGTILLAAGVVDATANDDRRPVVSSPSTTGEVMMAYETLGAQGTSTSGRIVPFFGGTSTGRANLSTLDAAFGIQNPSPSAPEIDCDGYTFSLARQGLGGDGSLDVRLATFKRFGSSVQLVRAAAVVSVADEAGPGIAAHYSSSGVPSGQHGLAWRSYNGATRPFAGIYDSTGPILLQSFGTGCGNGPQIAASGSTQLGQTFTITLSGGSGLTGFVVGQAAVLPIGPCPGCTLWVDGTVVVGNSFAVQVPPLLGLVGTTVATQGFTFDATGACLGAIDLCAAVGATISW